MSNNSSCYYTPGQYIVLITIRSSTSFISFIACIIVLAIMVLFKKYMFAMQRMIMYLNITLLLNSLANSANGLSFDEASNLKLYCTITGFLDQYTSLCVLIAITSFTVNIFLQGTFKWKINKLFELLEVACIFAIPIIFSMIPFYFHAYGYAGVWCWIKVKEEDCSEFPAGMILQFALLYAPAFVLYPLLICILLSCFAISITRDTSTRQGSICRHHK